MVMKTQLVKMVSMMKTLNKVFVLRDEKNGQRLVEFSSSNRERRQQRWRQREGYE